MYDYRGIMDLLANIVNGIDPTTGEEFDPRELYNRPDLHRITKELDGIAAGKKKPESRNRLNRPATAIFEELRAWRLDQATEKQLPPYCIFSDKDLWSIAEGDVCKKEDLLMVYGISTAKYEEYGDDIFEILSDYIDKD